MEQISDIPIILDLCCGTGSWSLPYRNAGYDVKLIDIHSGSNNIDVRLYHKPKFKVFGVLAAPPCTHLAGSGATWWREKGEKALLESLSIVDACLRIITITQPTFWVLENPVGRLVHYLGEPKYIFNPCDYGDPYTKKTLLWGNFNIPHKNPVEPTEGSKTNTKISDARERARTPSGFANAFFKANQCKYEFFSKFDI